MDLLDFNDGPLYFEMPLPPEAGTLLAEAAHDYNAAGCELALLRAHLLAPDHLAVLVALYRCYYFQHRLPEALRIAERALAIAGRQLGLPGDWRQMDAARLGQATANSFGLLRFYLLALKAVGIVLLRQGEVAASRARLCKLAELDGRDALGAARLLSIVDLFQPHGAPPAAAPLPV